MFRKMISLPLFAAAVSVAAHGFVDAECNTCVGGHGPFSGCPNGNCFGRLLSGLGQPASVGGPCMTCDNIWDDYCAEKERCLPQARYPFQNQGCGGCGHCSSCCNTGVGVGIYGKCAAGTCSSGRDTCAVGAYGGAGLLHKLFKHAHPVSHCDQGCADCAAASVAPAPAYHNAGQPAPMYAPAAPEGEAPGVSAPAPVGPSKENTAPAVPAAPDSPSDLPGDLPSARMTPQVPVPPAPAPARVSRKGSTGAFSWLQDALRIN